MVREGVGEEGEGDIRIKETRAVRGVRGVKGVFRATTGRTKVARDPAAVRRRGLTDGRQGQRAGKTWLFVTKRGVCHLQQPLAIAPFETDRVAVAAFIPDHLGKTH